MKQKPAILIYGRSLFSDAIEVTLAECASISIIRCHPDQTFDPAAMATAVLIIIEATSRLSHRLAWIQHQNIPILIVDVLQGKMTLINQKQHPFQQMVDLVNMVVSLTRPDSQQGAFP